MIDTTLQEWILDNLEYRLEKVEGKKRTKWCYPKEDYSGRDFYDYIPLERMSDDQIESLEESVWEDFEYEHQDEDSEYADFEWEDFHEIFEEVFYSLVDENLGR